ncbi:hypothetical protein [Tahibacter sp.]|uniref:hypothetical protein n=1 Tax=Tahibacter sp. TaxID=2056211 RepID=UPI0028C3AA36|nr:hypothetical protein [Tahibacter sp.]
MTMRKGEWRWAYRSCLGLGAAALVAASPAGALGSLGIPDTISGYPTNVGFLIIGHSTSGQGQYPAKLIASLNDAAHVEDARHYVQFSAITPSDGGMLWSLLSVSPGDTRYERVTASAGAGETSSPQWCESADAQRWSCRRAKIDHLLDGSFPLPATGTCNNSSITASCAQPASAPCTWYDRTLPLNQNPVTQMLPPTACWQRMDYRIALIQDTSNRSWPIDDYDASGAVDGNDVWDSTRVPRARALPCPASSGVVSGRVDWNCDGAIGAEDGVLAVYAGWLRKLSDELLDDGRYGAAALDAVLITQKPVEMGQCSLWPSSEGPICAGDRHALRTPTQIASTPGRPMDHYYVPTAFWEHRVIEFLFAEPGLDPRILPASPGDARRMWNRSAACYALGQSDTDWHIPAKVAGRPTTIASDDSEIDTGGAATSATVGCMVADHIHHNDNGGWMMADVWYQGLSGPLWSQAEDLIFADAFE